MLKFSQNAFREHSCRSPADPKSLRILIRANGTDNHPVCPHPFPTCKKGSPEGLLFFCIFQTYASFEFNNTDAILNRIAWEISSLLPVLVPIIRSLAECRSSVAARLSGVTTPRPGMKAGGPVRRPSRRLHHTRFRPDLQEVYEIIRNFFSSQSETRAYGRPKAALPDCMQFCLRQADFVPASS